jgi:cell division septation protein DedD
MSVENPSIQPEKLNAAIACLDLSLESELALYRNRLSQATVALASLPSAESESLALTALDSTDDPGLFSPEGIHGDDHSEGEPKVLDQGLATIEADDEETLPESYSAELTAQPKAFDQFLDPSIDDYLQSSETLLKHLHQPAEAEVALADDAVPAPKRSWVMVAGITLLALGTLALAGFLIMLGVRWFSIKSASTAQTDIQPSPLPTLSPSPLPSSAIANSPVTASGTTPVPLPTEGISPQPNATVSPGAIAATEGVPTQPNPSGTPTSSPSINPNASRYVVLAVANSPESLQTAQRLVPDAYVIEVEGQKRIQMASLESLQQAQQMVNELKNQGFPATIVAQN